MSIIVIALGVAIGMLIAAFGFIALMANKQFANWYINKVADLTIGIYEKTDIF